MQYEQFVAKDAHRMEKMSIKNIKYNFKNGYSSS